MRFHLPFAITIAAFALSACGQEEVLYIDKGWVRLPAVPGNPGAAYFTVHGGPNADTLIRVTSDVAIKTEMHEMKSEGGVAKMAPVQSVPVPAHRKVEFKPGGMHVMMFDMRRNLKAGDVIRLDFTFASGEQIYIEAPAQAAGSQAPEHEGH